MLWSTRFRHYWYEAVHSLQGPVSAICGTTFNVCCSVVGLFSKNTEEVISKELLCTEVNLSVKNDDNAPMWLSVFIMSAFFIFGLFFLCFFLFVVNSSVLPFNVQANRSSFYRYVNIRRFFNGSPDLSLLHIDARKESATLGRLHSWIKRTETKMQWGEFFHIKFTWMIEWGPHLLRLTAVRPHFPNSCQRHCVCPFGAF